MSYERGEHIITVVTEHKAILDTCKKLEKRGFKVTYLPVSSEGLISPDDVKNAITDKTILVSVMMANNEIGVIQPIAEIGKVCKERGVLFHTDATQAIGKIPFTLMRSMSIWLHSAHTRFMAERLGGLYVRRKNPRVMLVLCWTAAGRERDAQRHVECHRECRARQGMRTCEGPEMSDENVAWLGLREKLRKGIMDSTLMSTSTASRAATTGQSQCVVRLCRSESLLMHQRYAVSSGSACTSASLEPTMFKGAWRGEELAHSSIRFGLGRFNTEEEVNYTIAVSTKQ